ncbi:MAG: restriction endonuclease subunit S [Paludibacteraceae bacterium]|nr:restriction endonuclease subunit S [Paludibacteraceae bacterium]
MKKIAEIAEIRTGIYAKPHALGETLYLQLKDLVDNTPIESIGRIFYSDKNTSNLLAEGDVLFAGKGFNYFSTVYNHVRETVASNIFFILRVKSDCVTPEYLNWVLNQTDAKMYFKANQAGTGIPVIRKQVIADFEFDVPPIVVQNKVVELQRLMDREKSLTQTILDKKQLLQNQILRQIIKNQ